MDVFRDNWHQIWVAMVLTLEMVVVAGVIALVVGSVLAAMRVGPIALGRAIGTSYVFTIRNTPLLVLMLISVFFLPVLGFRPRISIGDIEYLQFNSFTVYATLTLGLYTAAFVCEALRSGINSVPLGQAEAARSIGMTFGQTFRRVVLPQATAASIPPVTSALIAMTKNSSIAAGVGVIEATSRMQKLQNNDATALYTLFIGFALFYMIVVGLIAVVSALLERQIRVVR